MRQAIHLVRTEQGPDAVILSTRQVDGGVEIISAIDYDQNLISEMVETANPPSTARRAKHKAVQGARERLQTNEVRASTDQDTGASARKSSAARAVESESDNASLLQMQRELNAMKSLLHDQLSQLAWGQFSNVQPLKAQHIKRLRALGFSPKLALEIVDDVREINNADKSWRDVVLNIAKRLPVANNQLVDDGGNYALVGPTGVGKTTSIAKLAARFVLRHGLEQVALVTVDTFRIGAQQQLQTYGQILGVPVYRSNLADLGLTLATLTDKRLILIDTPGINPRDAQAQAQLEHLSGAVPLRTLLVLSANTQRCALDETVRCFRAHRPEGCILTKLDEAVSLGGPLSAIVAGRLRLSYVSDGQRVPEDLHIARVSDLISRTLSLAREFEHSTEQEMLVLPTLPLTKKEITAHAHL